MTEQDQGNPTPADEATTSAPAHPPASASADYNPVPSGTTSPPEPHKKYTDKDVDKLKGDARKEARQAAANDLLRRLGVESIEDAETALGDYRTIQDATKTEIEVEREAKEAAQQAIQDATDRANKLEESRKQDLIRFELKDALRDAGINKERLSLALRVADTSSVEVSEEGVANLSAVVEQVKQDSPEWFGQRETLPETPEGSTKRKSAAQSFMDRKYGTKK